MAKFVKGQSGNPGGRPKVAEEFRKKCRDGTDLHVVDAWLDEMQIRERPVVLKDGTVVMISQRGPEWMRASENLAANGYGKPAQPLEHSGSGGEALSIDVHFVKSERK